MGGPSKKKVAEAVLERHGKTFAKEMRIDVSKNTPAPLYQLLNASILFSARISADRAAEAARALIDAGLTTPEKMREASWQDRVDVITWHGYKRYDERTATMLGEAAEQVLEWYGGDLRNLREEAERDPAREHGLLRRLKGLGPVGASIFLREAQVAWDEAFPYADGKVLKAAEKLGLGSDVDSLRRLVSKKDFPRLVAGLVRTDLAKDYDEVKSAAAA